MDISTGMLERARNRGIYRDIRVGVLGETLDYKTDSYDAVLSSGVFTPGHAPPGSFSELARIVRPGGFICFSLRHDATPPGFHETMKALADEGRWELVEVSDPYQPMPKGEPEVEHRLWALPSSTIGVITRGFDFETSPPNDPLYLVKGQD